MAGLDHKKIIEKFILDRNLGEFDPLSLSTHLLTNAFELAFTTYNNPVLSKEVKAIAVHNLLINTVTSLEVFFKHMIIQIKNWDVEGYKTLLSDKITLSEAFDLFHNNQVTREYLIAHYHKFQNFDTIGGIFSKLIGNKDFYKEVERHRVDLIDYKGERRNYIFMEIYPDWRELISNIYQARNAFVHEIEYHAYIKNRLVDVLGCTLTFMLVITNYLESKYDSKPTVDSNRIRK